MGGLLRHRACAIGALVSLLLAILLRGERYLYRRAFLSDSGRGGSRSMCGNATAAASVNEEATALLRDARDANETAVLIVRTVSPSEVDNVVADVRTITSYRESMRWPLDGNASNPNDLLAASMSQCDELRNATSGGGGGGVPIDVFRKGSAVFPNRVLCDANRTSLTENNYLAVKADFFLFAKDGEVVESIEGRLADLGVELGGGMNQIEVADVSENPIKIWNWLNRLTSGRLVGYDYVWMMDGDISASTLNWHAYWQQVKLTNPRLAQPAIIGTGPGRFSSDHGILRHIPDHRVLAAETAIIELMAPMFRTSTWLGFREVIFNQPSDLLRNLAWGGEDCFDLAWCHYAKTGFNSSLEGGHQIRPGRGSNYHVDNPHYSSEDDATGRGEFKDESCVVFYQTPMVHMDKHALAKQAAFRKGGQHTCKYLRENFHIHFFNKAVYKVLVMPP